MPQAVHSASEIELHKSSGSLLNRVGGSSLLPEKRSETEGRASKVHESRRETHDRNDV